MILRDWLRWPRDSAAIFTTAALITRASASVRRRLNDVLVTAAKRILPASRHFLAFYEVSNDVISRSAVRRCGRRARVAAHASRRRKRRAAASAD